MAYTCCPFHRKDGWLFALFGIVNIVSIGAWREGYQIFSSAHMQIAMIIYCFGSLLGFLIMVPIMYRSRPYRTEGLFRCTGRVFLDPANCLYNLLFRCFLNAMFVLSGTPIAVGVTYFLQMNDREPSGEMNLETFCFLLAQIAIFTMFLFVTLLEQMLVEMAKEEQAQPVQDQQDEAQGAQGQTPSPRKGWKVKSKRY